MNFIRSRKHLVGPSIGMATWLAASSPLAHAQTAPTETVGEDAVDSAQTDQQRDPPQDGREDGRRRDDRRREERERVQVTGAAPFQAESRDAKSTAPLVNTPQTVQIINEELIRDQAATTLTEALKNSPGVGTFFLGENGSTNTGDAIYMRGSDASGSIFIDGVRDVGSVSRDTFNIEQIEVLKGAAGADIGRGAATGAINLVTKRPRLQQSESASLGVGEGDYLRGTADMNWTLGDNSGLRLNLMVQDAGVAGRDYVKNKRWGVAPTFGWGINGPTRIFVSYVHIDQDNVPDGGVLTIGLPGYTTPSPGARDFLNTAPRVDTSNWYGTKDDHDKVENDTASIIVEHDFSDQAALTNVTRWSETDQEYQLSSFLASATNLVTPNPNDPSTWTIASRNINNKDATNTVLTNQTNLRATFSTGFMAHTVSTGVEFIREEQKTRAFATSPTTYPAFSVYNPNPNVAGYQRLLSGAFTKGRTDTVGVYLNDTIQFTNWLQATGGLRYDHYKTDYESITVAGLPAAGTPLQAKDDLISGKIGLVYKPMDPGSVYVSYAVTKQPPGGANFSLSATNAANANNPNVDPQEAKTTEGGVKWQFFDSRLLVSGSLYQTKYSDTITLDPNTGDYDRTGEKSVKGIELGVVGQITPNWNISAGYTTMDTEVKNATLVTADGTPVLTYTPDAAATLWTTYRIGDFTIGGGGSYVGEMKRGTDGAVGTPKFVESHVVFDAVAKYQITRAAELQLNVYNLFDEDYVASINKSGYRYTPGVPRSVRLTLNVGF